MLDKLIHPLPFIFTLVMAFGVMMHDTHVDKATNMAIAVPVLAAGYAATSDSGLGSKSSEHTHIERVAMTHRLGALRTGLPKIQPRDDDRRHVQLKRTPFGMTESATIWPSV